MGNYPFAAAAAGTTPWLPADSGLLIATGDQETATASFLLIAGTLYLRKLNVRSSVLVTNLWFGLPVVGAGASTGSFAGLYSSTGTLLSGSADIATQFTTAIGGISCPLTTPQQLTAGTFVWAAVLSNLATTQPTLSKASVINPISNLNLTAATFRIAINGTGLSVLPGSITPASNAQANSASLWVGGN